MKELYKLAGDFDPALNTERWTNPFNLENGQEQLEPFFSTVEMYRYPDSLVITKAEPLVDYILSSTRLSHIALDKARIAALRTFVTQKIEQEGAIRVQKDTGMFVACTEY